MNIEKYQLEVSDLGYHRRQDYHKTTLKSWLLNSECRRAEETILENISFSLNQGEQISIIGKNGSGKSTLLKLIASKLRPTSGRVFYPGRIQYYNQLELCFNEELTGLENLKWLAGFVYSHQQEKNIVDFAVEFSELGHNINRRLESYSSGMKGRLALSLMAFQLNELTLFDEVATFVDVDFKNKFLDHIKNISQNQKSYIWISHNPNELLKMSNRCLWLEKGRLIFDGNIKKALSMAYMFSEKNLGGLSHAEV